MDYVIFLGKICASQMVFNDINRFVLSTELVLYHSAFGKLL